MPAEPALSSAGSGASVRGAGATKATRRALPPIEHLELETDSGAVPLGYVRSGSTVYLIARERSAQWPVDALRAGQVRFEMAGTHFSGRIRLEPDPARREEILRSFRERYGAEAFARWYERPARVLVVDLSERPGVAGPGEYERWLESEFDNLADDYDHHITGNRMNRLLRDRSLAQLRPLFRSARRLIEVGCGSGMETLPLLREGHEVVAVDVSDRMLAVVRGKARAEGLSERLTTEKMRAVELPALVARYGESSFQGAYSTYGALNCEPDLRPIPGALARLLSRDGAFLAGVYNRWCLSELLGYAFTGQLQRAGGRRQNPIRVGASRFCIDVYAYSGWEFARLFAPCFDLERVEGVPVLLPPSDLTSYAEKFSRRFSTLAMWDAWVGRRWPFAYLGDHFLMTFRPRAR